MKKFKIDMSKTAYGRLLATKKKELTAATSKMDAEELQHLGKFWTQEWQARGRS